MEQAKEGTDARPIVFVHIPKTAGTLVRHMLSARFGRRESLDLDIPSREQEQRAGTELTLEYFSSFRFIAGHFRYDFLNAKLPEAQILTFLREPVSRCLSLFSFLKERGQKDLLAEPERNEVMKRLSLKEFFFSDEDIVQRLRDNHHIRFLGAAVLTQDRTLDEMLALSKERLAAMEFFGIVERMNESLMMMCKTFNISMSDEVPWINRSRRMTPEQADAALIRRIEETNRYDIELYGFANRLFSQRWDEWLAEVACGTWPRWLPGAERNRYTERMRQESGPPPKRLRTDFAGPVTGWGWYAWDGREDGEYFRWSTSKAGIDARIDTTRPLRLRFEAANMLDANALASIQVTANGYPLALAFHRLDMVPWAIVEAPLPPAALAKANGLVQLEFEAPTAARPRDVLPDSRDDRLLGVAVAWLELVPE